MRLVIATASRDEADAVDPAWLAPDAPEIFWVDIEQPGEAERQLLAETSSTSTSSRSKTRWPKSHHPKIEPYDDVPLPDSARHRGRQEAATGFETQDIDFFLGRNYLVTVHHASVAVDRGGTGRAARGTARCWARARRSLLHRIIDRMVDHYGPEVDALEDRLEELEHARVRGAGRRIRCGRSCGLKSRHRLAAPRGAAAARRRRPARAAGVPADSRRARVPVPRRATTTSCG